MNVYNWSGLVLIVGVIVINTYFTLSGYYFDNFSWGFLSGAAVVGGLFQWLGGRE